MERCAQGLIKVMVTKCSTDLEHIFAGAAIIRRGKACEVTKKAVTELVKLEVFFTEILKLWPNGRVPKQVLIDALLHIDSFSLSGGGDRPYMWNFQPGPTLAAAMRLAATMQKTLATLRVLKNNPMRYMFYLRGQTIASEAVINKLLAAMTPGKADAMQCDQMDDVAINMDIFDQVMSGGLRSHTDTDVAAVSLGRPPCARSLSSVRSLDSAGSAISPPNKAAVIPSLPTKVPDSILDSVASRKSKPEANHRWTTTTKSSSSGSIRDLVAGRAMRRRRAPLTFHLYKQNFKRRAYDRVYAMSLRNADEPAVARDNGRAAYRVARVHLRSRLSSLQVSLLAGGVCPIVV